MNTGIENRRHPRMSIDWPIALKTSKGVIKGKTANISVGGALFLFSEMPKINDEFQVTIKPSENHEIQVTCEKAWSSEIKINVFLFKGIGVRFTKISSRDRKTIATMVAAYQ